MTSEDRERTHLQGCEKMILKNLHCVFNSFTSRGQHLSPHPTHHSKGLFEGQDLVWGLVD